MTEATLHTAEAVHLLQQEAQATLPVQPAGVQAVSAADTAVAAGAQAAQEEECHVAEAAQEQDDNITDQKLKGIIS